MNGLYIHFNTLNYNYDDVFEAIMSRHDMQGVDGI
jgi:hypothetical protein